MDNYFITYTNKEEFNKIMNYASSISAKLPNGHYISKYGKRALFTEGTAYIIFEKKKDTYYINNVIEVNKNKYTEKSLDEL